MPTKGERVCYTKNEGRTLILCSRGKLALTADINGVMDHG